MKHKTEGKLYERMLGRLIRVSRRHPLLRLPVLCCAFVILAIRHLGQALLKAAPRLATAAALGVAVLLCSSFSYQGEAEEAAIPGDQLIAQLRTEAAYEVSYAEDVRAAETPEDAYVGELSAEGDAIIVELRDPTLGDDPALWNEHGVIREEDIYSAEELLADYAASESAVRAESPALSEEELLASFDAEDWRLRLINKMHPIPEDYSFELGVIGNGMQCDARVADSLLAMISAAREDGVSLVVCSPYRASYSQVYLFEIKLERFMAAGMSYTEAYEKASQAVTVPGTSEHEVGLAFDIVTDSYRGLLPGFGETTAGRWLYEHSREYGFILRYPAGKEDITGIEYEPWHFRYVGVDAATYIMERGLTLEEFTELLRER